MPRPMVEQAAAEPARRDGAAFRARAARRAGAARHRRVQAAIAVARHPARRTTTRRRIARAYARAGAAAISVLTEPTFFDGSLDHLRGGARGGRRCRSCARTSSSRDYQILEARAAGADAVLLIVGALDAGRARGAARRARAQARRWRRSSRCTTTTSCAIAAGRRRATIDRRQQPQPADARRRAGGCSSGSRRGCRRRSWRSPRAACATTADLRAARRAGYRRVPRRRAADRRSRIPGAALPRRSSGGVPRVIARVKICGITTPEDARAGGASSARRRSASCSGRAARGSSSVDAGAGDRRGAAAVRRARSACSSNQPRGRVRDVAGHVGLDAVQLHGDEPAERLSRLRACRVIKAVAVRDARRCDAAARSRRARPCCSTRTTRCSAAAPADAIDWAIAADARARGVR